MPSVPEYKVRMCYVDQFLNGSNQFKGLFQCNLKEDLENPLTIPEELHRELGRNIFVGKDSIVRSLLTRKNLSNPQDISGENLYRHAKEVEANCKKALALCLRSDSPWKNFNGHYPSGKTWFDFIEWVRIEMYNVSNECPIVDILDVDLDAQPQESVSDGEEKQEEQTVRK